MAYQSDENHTTYLRTNILELLGDLMYIYGCDKTGQEHPIWGSFPSIVVEVDNGPPGPPKGFSKTEIEKIPNYTVTSENCELVKTCAVCLNNFKQKDAIRTYFCGHEFHIDCVDMWLSGNNSCPVCRRTFRFVEPEDIAKCSRHR